MDDDASYAAVTMIQTNVRAHQIRKRKQKDRGSNGAPSAPDTPPTPVCSTDETAAVRTEELDGWKLRGALSIALLFALMFVYVYRPIVWAVNVPRASSRHSSDGYSAPSFDAWVSQARELTENSHTALTAENEQTRSSFFCNLISIPSYYVSHIPSSRIRLAHLALVYLRVAVAGISSSLTSSPESSSCV